MAAGRVLDVLHTHPAVSAAAWDVLLSAVSFCVYAAVRGIDPSAMLKYSLAPWLKLSSASNEDVPVTSTKPAAASSKQKRGRKASSSAASNAITSGAKAAADAVKSTTKRKSSGTGRRPTRTKEDDDRVANITTENILESTRRSTRVKNPQQLSRITSRDTDDEDEDEDQEEDIDDSFVPTPATKRDVSSVVHSMAEAMPGNMGEVETAGEAAALGWGMFVLGGLGVLSSAVLGADG